MKHPMRQSIYWSRPRKIRTDNRSINADQGVLPCHVLLNITDQSFVPVRVIQGSNLDPPFLSH